MQKVVGSSPIIRSLSLVAFTVCRPSDEGFEPAVGLARPAPVNPLPMDDEADNLIPLSRRERLAEELVRATEWLDDLDSPLSAEQQAYLDADHSQLATASQRIRRARVLHEVVPLDRPPAA
jgi:hypothetical protein